MASTNKTSNLELSQFIATDTPTWLVDYNGDMEKIDAGVGRVEELAETASTQAVGVASGLQATNQTVTTLSGQVANVQNQANTSTASINGINQRLGNTDISGIGDGTITGAISAQNGKLNEYLNEYSTEEKAIGKWLDGKTIYRRTYTLSNVASGENSVFSLADVSDLNVETVIDVRGIVKRSDFIGNIPVYNLTGTMVFMPYYRPTNKMLTLEYKSSSTFGITIIFEYTKIS